MCGYVFFQFFLIRVINKINYDIRIIDKDKEIQCKGIFGVYGV